MSVVFINSIIVQLINLPVSVDWEPARVADAYAAALSLNSGFKLFISLDMRYAS